jgi:uncharacterized membrane protein YhfC
MDAPIAVGSGWIVVDVATILGMIALPLLLGLVARRRLNVVWRYFWFGALIFLLFQLVTRVPLVQITQALIAPQLQASRPLLFAWLGILALTAGLAEEIGRYLGYRWFMGREEKTWPKAVMYGLGHGGLESMVLVAGLAALGLVNVLLLPSLLPTLPTDQRARATQALTAIAAQPAWVPLLGLWERAWAIAFHVAMSVVVLQVFRRNNITWLWLAVALHTAFDGVTVFLQQLLPLEAVAKALVVEGVIALMGLGCLWLLFALRDRPDEASESPAAQIIQERTS